MANPKMKTEELSNTNSLPSPAIKTALAIKTTEHDVAREELSRHPSITVASADPRVGIGPPRDPRQTLRNIQAAQMGNRQPGNVNMYSLTLNLRQNLDAWKPVTKKGKTAKNDLGQDLKVLDDVLFQESLEQEIEAGKTASIGMIADPSSPSAPSPEKLREDLAALAEDDPTRPLPVALQAAVEKFQEGYDECFGAEQQPAHPKPSHGLHRDHGPEPAPETE